MRSYQQVCQNSSTVPSSVQNERLHCFEAWRAYNRTVNNNSRLFTLTITMVTTIFVHKNTTMSTCLLSAKKKKKHTSQQMIVFLLFLSLLSLAMTGLSLRPCAAPGASAVLRRGHECAECLWQHGPAHLCPLQTGESMPWALGC